jgi:hypothetical protein
MSTELSGEVELSLLQVIRLKLGSTRARSGQEDRYRDALKKIDRVLAHLDHSDRPPVWYEDPQAKPGRWVQFEASLAFGYGTSIFLMWTITDESTAAPRDPTVPRTILILHGSVEHTLQYRESAERLRESISSQRSGSRASLLFDNLTLFLAKPIPATSDDWVRANRDAWVAKSALELSKRDHSLLKEGFGDMAGFARVSLSERIADDQGVEYRIIIASPLYVEQV